MANGRNAVVCTYCRISFEDKMDLRAHCHGEEHQRVIMSDEGRDWSWRAPPRGNSADAYVLCEHWMETGVCRFGLQCVEAHGQDELHEWIERFEYRRMKLQRAYDSELYGKSYVEELIDKLVQSIAPETIMCADISGIIARCDQQLSLTIREKNTRQHWVFTLSAAVPMKAVALLQDTHRAYFNIQSIKVLESGEWCTLNVSNPQEWIGVVKMGAVDENAREYEVEISFDADIYGTFRQSIIFDFGCEPLLVKHLCVDVVPISDFDKLIDVRQELLLSSSDRWNENNVEIVRFMSPFTALVPTYSGIASEWAKNLAAVYPMPNADYFTLSQATLNEKRLTKNAYRARMHELLYVEEMARYGCIAQFNIVVKMSIINSYLLSSSSTASSTAKYSSSGELFAYITLSNELSEDTAAGRLILNNCTTILLSEENDDKNDSRKVYEVLIEDKGKSVIYLRLSASTVSELSLQANSELCARVQFQLNRIPYCEWHYAIDKVPDFKIVFPDILLEPQIPWSPSRQWSNTLDSRMNLKQKEAVVAITTPLHVNLPPVLIIGPFGTGKTFTLAQAIKELVKEPGNRILICTQSNSAADLYIKDYLDPHVKAGNENARPLRIYYEKRWVATVHQSVQKYCLIQSVNGAKQFIVPSTEDIMKHKIIVVTLSISMYLATIGLPRGFFTHIFLDEAAQAMECEAIMPLALANESTRIVLAGDHMQLSPELFSPFAKERNLHLSLLERLYDHYPKDFPCKILLSEIYRSHEAIIQFTSESFYDQKLIASGRQPRHEVFYPLTFFTSRGEDVQDDFSTAFYNNAEVYEIVDRVQEMRKHWPPAWGKFDDHSIGVMTPYSDQVLRIRSELRKRRLYGVAVERVLNVQGKQFRAVFLSTVRTRRTCRATDDSDFGFLSNSKLLNTAVTRAQSLVAVVGDPVSLCTIGRCSKVWERFIQICDEHKSLHGITWSALRSQMDGVELKKTYTLNPLAPEFVPRRFVKPAVHTLIAPNMLYVMRPPPPTLLHGSPLMYSGMNGMVVAPQYLIPPQQMHLNGGQVHNQIVYTPLQMQPALRMPIDPLGNLVNFMPPNISLAEMLQQPPMAQNLWYYYLLNNVSAEAAKQFAQLMQTATRKHLLLQHIFHQPTNAQAVSVASNNQPSEPFFMQREIDENAKNNRPTMEDSAKSIPIEWQQQINDHFANMPVENGESGDEMKQYKDFYAHF